MSDKGKRVIFVGPADGSNHKPLNVEGVATEAVPPGSVIDFAAADAGLELADDAATVFGKILMVADKDQQRSKSVDDAWTINENMVGIQPRSGEFVNILVITGQAVLKGLPLGRSATPGALQLAATDGTDEIEAYADESVTTTATQLVRCRKA
jgi:hypothetical protein